MVFTREYQTSVCLRARIIACKSCVWVIPSRLSGQTSLQVWHLCAWGVSLKCWLSNWEMSDPLWYLLVSSYWSYWTHPQCTTNSSCHKPDCYMVGQLVYSLATILWFSIVEKPLSSGYWLSYYSLTVLMDAMQVFLWSPPTHCTCSQPGRQESSWSLCNVALTDCLSDKNFDTIGAGSLALEGSLL